MTSPYAGTTPVSSLGAAVTLVEGQTFAVSSPNGDMDPERPQGLFVLDTRVLSRWELLLNGHQLEPLQVVAQEPYQATFLSRGAPALGQADTDLVVFRARHVGQGMREQIQVTIITDMLAPRARALAALASDVISGAFLVLVLVTAVETLRADGDSTMVSLPVPLALVSASLTIGALLMLGHIVARILAALAGRGAPAR